MKRDIAARLLSTTGIGRLLASVLPAKGALILNYHRIGDGSASPYDRALWSATVEGFDAQVRFLATHCDVIAPADLDEALQRKKGRYVAITFDDGYLDNYQLAFPVLRSRNVPATFFVATGFIDRPTIPWWDEIAWSLRQTRHGALPLMPWFDAPLALSGDRSLAIRAVLSKYKALPGAEAQRMLQALREAVEVSHPEEVGGHWMNWDMVREMSAAGMTIGGHTVSHPILSRLPAEQQRREIEGCAARILAETGSRMEYFAYPVGNRDSFDAATLECLREAGVKRAFSYYGGFAKSESPPHDTPRIAIEASTSFREFEAMARLPQVFNHRPYA